MKRRSGCVLYGLSFFFLKFLKLFSAFSNSQKVRVRQMFGVGISLSYKNSTLTFVTILPAIWHLINRDRLPVI